MLEVFVGLLAVAIGAVFCFSGNIAMRVIFPFWGFFIGFVAGSGAVTAISGDGFFSTVLGWAIGFAVGIVLGICAYLFYAFAVVLAFASFGFALTSATLAVVGADWNWLIVLVGSFVAVVLAVAAIRYSAPTLVLIVVTSFAGAFIVIQGTLLVFNIIELNGYAREDAIRVVRDNWLWFVAWLGVAALGLSAQFATRRQNQLTMQDMWDQSAHPEDVFQVLVVPKN